MECVRPSRERNLSKNPPPPTLPEGRKPAHGYADDEQHRTSTGRRNQGRAMAYRDEVVDEEHCPADALSALEDALGDEEHVRNLPNDAPRQRWRKFTDLRLQTRRRPSQARQRATYKCVRKVV